MIEFRISTPQDISCIMEIWNKAINATHHFLAFEDRLAIEKELFTFFPTVELTLACESSGCIIGFMYLHDGHMEALFVDPDYHGQGVGKAMVHTALAQSPELTIDVNKQNQQAVGFYTRIGFDQVGHSEFDSQDRPYPLIHLRYRQHSGN
ncbi:acetyltransferase [Candidatus Symbiopectobacterium sp. 'North America']|uniref:acetyltransferase n=1 Tax=Candidatus Symbiopectobacterium sp. 'North America' TaxID=2794574 RepID=UPI0018CA00A9|nr:acetyltransferase [Candidatus Symbiopectobacterium sp. 'North America']MBG6246572.1 acetyltransferase [Candidatus Symbiopectobacterium sp. 'North America']